MKLSLAIMLVTLVLVAGTVTICLSGAVTLHNSEYASVHAAIGHWLGRSRLSPPARQTIER